MNIWKTFFGAKKSEPTKPSAKETSQVTFQREVRKQHPLMPNIQTIIKLYSAPNKEVAVAFLRNQNITEGFLYIEVATPSGIFGIDRMGEIYDSGGLQLHKKPSQSEISDWKVLSEAFHDAAESGNLEKVKAMLKDNPNLVFSRIAFFGDTPLHAAASKGHKDVVELLLDNGADVNVRDQNDQTPLHDTAGHGHTNVVELLLAKGADVNAKMHGGSTPLRRGKDHKDVVELLRKYGGRE